LTLQSGHSADVHGDVTVRGRSNILAGIFIAVVPLILASAPVGTGLVRVAWALPILGVIPLVIVRSARMGVTAGPLGLIVRNLGRDYHVPWDDVAAIEAGASDNVTGLVTTIVIRRTDGRNVVARGASSYSRRAVERWRDELNAVRLRHR
jgi:hypothetical protein